MAEVHTVNDGEHSIDEHQVSTSITSIRSLSDDVCP